MKNIIITIFLLLIIPITVSANIICNDGTESSTCQECHTGCCSGHNGCTDNPNNNSYKNSDIKKTNKKNSDYKLPITVGLISYILSSIALCLADKKFNIENKILHFYEQHDFLTVINFIVMLGLVVSLGWITIPLYLAKEYSITFEIISIFLITIISYILIIVENG